MEEEKTRSAGKRKIARTHEVRTRRGKEQDVKTP